VVLLSFLVGLVLVLVASVYAVRQGVTLWREGRRTGARFMDELSLFEERATRTEEFLADMEGASRRLEASLDRLRASRAQLQVLLASLETAQRRTRWLRAFLPLR
jgi:hypothetical protein